MKTYARLIGIALVTVSTLTALAACGTEKLSDDEVAREVRAEVLKPRGIARARVKCPKETEATKDTTILCTVADRDRNKGVVVATVTDEDGDLGRYRPDVDRLQIAVVERNAAEAGREKGIKGKVDCPNTKEPKSGATHFCTANIRDSGVGVVIVTQKDQAASNVEVKVQRRRLRTVQIERNISKAVRKQGINAAVKCPAHVTSQKGKTFECKVRNPANGRELTIVATQKDDLGNFDLEVKK